MQYIYVQYVWKIGNWMLQKARIPLLSLFPIDSNLHKSD